MQNRTRFAGRGSDTHRYFPEWADRAPTDGTSLEADRNSYSAGGYAEEFGYRNQPGQPRPAPVLHADPEASRQWCTQHSGLHPGYPECGKPVDRDRSEAGTRPGAQAPRGSEWAKRGDRQTKQGQSSAFKVILVAERRQHMPPHGHSWYELIAWWRELRERGH